MLSQKVFTDIIKETTLLDKQATIATGNLLKQGEGYKGLYSEQSILVDSLWFQINLHQKENETYRLKIIPSLEDLNKEQKVELQHTKEKNSLSINLLQAELKNEKGKKWTFGSVGVGAGIILTLLTVIIVGG